MYKSWCVSLVLKNGKLSINEVLTSELKSLDDSERVAFKKIDKFVFSNADCPYHSPIKRSVGNRKTLRKPNKARKRVGKK